MQTTRTLTLLNSSGDLSIAWDESHDDAVAKVIEKKMKEGVRFFITAPFTDKEIRVKKLADVKGREVHIKDSDIEKLFADGAVGTFKRVKGKTDKETVKVSTDPKEVARSSSVGVRAMRGG